MDNTIRQIVGERVHLLRRRAGLSQPDLAEKAHMSVTALNRVENGHQSLYIEKLVALALALGTTTDFLCGLNDEYRKPGRSHREDDADTAATPPKQPTRQRTRKAASVA